MKYIVLASGSKGNSTIIDNGKNLIVIDVGICISEFKNKLINNGYKFENVDAVLITHNHNDHTRAIKYFDEYVLYGDKTTLEVHKENILEPFVEREINGFTITPLPLSHDTENCFGYIVESNGEKLVYITDTGYINYKLFNYIKNAEYYIIESNHDVKMLVNSNRPGYLKNRILSDTGHLSNELASEYLSELIGKKTKEIVFAHISEETNSDKKIIETFKKTMLESNVDISSIKLKIADQVKETIGGN